MMDDLLSLSRMARQIGVTQKWLKGQADSGLVPCIKADRRYLFSPLAVKESLAAEAATQRQGGTTHAR